MTTHFCNCPEPERDVCVSSLTWEVQGGEGISLCTPDHVGDLVHDALLSQILSPVLAVG